jgi:acyl-CoA dehydrogenase
MSEFEFIEPDILDEEHRLLRAQLRAFVDKVILPQADAWEVRGDIPRDLFLQLGRLGFLGMRHPTEYGGGGMGALASVILGEELGRSTYGGVAAAITVHSDMSIAHIAHCGNWRLRPDVEPGTVAHRRAH